MTDTPTRLGPCPTCGHQRVEYATCTCDHGVLIHIIGKRGGKTVRTSCSSYECGCQLFTPKEINDDRH